MKYQVTSHQIKVEKLEICARIRCHIVRIRRDLRQICQICVQLNKQTNKEIQKKTPRFKQACQKKLRFRVSLKSERKQQRYSCAVLWLVEKNQKKRRGSNRLGERSLNPEFRWNRSVNMEMAADWFSLIGTSRDVIGRKNHLAKRKRTRFSGNRYAALKWRQH